MAARSARIDVLDASGKAAGSVELDPNLFAIDPVPHVMHQAVVAQLAAGRRGTSKTRSRGEVRGGGAKPWRQKGTGRARQGSIRAPQWSGGGIAHGPTGERNYAKRINKKVKRLALASALSDRFATGDVRVIDSFGIGAPRTKDAVALLGALELAAAKVLIVCARRDDAVSKSFRNLPGAHVLDVGQLNTYDVLAADVVVFEQAALDALPQRPLSRRERGDDGAAATAAAGSEATDGSDEE